MHPEYLRKLVKASLRSRRALAMRQRLEREMAERRRVDREPGPYTALAG